MARKVKKVRRGVLTRSLTKKEYPWIPKYLKKGTVVYEYIYCVYGDISSRGIAVSLVPNETPFFEVKKSDVDWNE